MANDPAWVSDLEKNNIESATSLRDALKNSTDVIKAIKEFQEKNYTKNPRIEPALKLLDALNVRRAEFHDLAIIDLTERIVMKLKSLGTENTVESLAKVEKQLESCFKLYRVPKVRPIVLEALQQLPKVPNRYLEVIASDREFYESCGVGLKQQIWFRNDALFVDALVPIIDNYVNNKKRLLFTIDQTPINFFTAETTKSRRQWKQVQDLVMLAGHHESLYTRLISVVRERFVESGDTIYCSLRMEIVMAAHDNKVPVEKMGDNLWIIGDHAMVAADVHVVHFLASVAIKLLKDIATQALHLPRELPTLHIISMLMAFGGAARIVLTRDTPCDEVLNPFLLTKFVPLLTSLMAEDTIRNELSKAPDGFPGVNSSAFLSQPSEALVEFLKIDTSCSLLWLYYMMDLFLRTQRPIDLSNISQCLPFIQMLHDNLAYRDPWIHLFTHRLIHSVPKGNLLRDQNMCSLIFDDYLLHGLEKIFGAEIPDDDNWRQYAKDFYEVHTKFVNSSIGLTEVRSAKNSLADDDISRGKLA